VSDIKSSIIESPKFGKLGWEIVRGRYVPISSDIGVYPYFSSEVVQRIRHQKACNVIFCGEPGISKTYTAVGLARYVQPNFTERQIAYTYVQYMELQINLPEGYVIVMDEPEYIAGHRDWYNDVNKALVATTRSGRFRVHPLFIPTINKSLLDKVIRKYLIQYMVWMDERGEGTVYKVSPNKFNDSVLHIPLYKLRMEMLDLPRCDVPWCLGCPKFEDNSCKLLRANYEHVRKEIQLKRYKEDLQTTQRSEALVYTIPQLEELALKFKDAWTLNKAGNIEVQSILLGFEERMGILLTERKASQLAKRLSMKYKESLSPSSPI